MKKIKLLSMILAACTLLSACTPQINGKIETKKEVDVISNVTTSESYAVNFKITGESENAPLYVAGQFGISDDGTKRSVIGSVSVNDDIHEYKEYIDFQKGEKYIYNIKERKWETNKAEVNDQSLLNLVTPDCVISETQDNYILSNSIPYNQFRKIIKITEQGYDDGFTFPMNYEIIVNKTSFNIVEINLWANESTTENNLNIKSFTVKISPHPTEKTVFPEEIASKISNAASSTSSNDVSNNASSTTSTDSSNASSVASTVEEAVYEEIDAPKLFSIGSYSLDEIRMIISDQLNEAYPEDEMLYNYIIENITQIRTIAAEDTKDFTTDQILEVLFMMSGFMNEDETLNIKEGVLYEKNEENPILEKIELDINGYKYENAIVGKLLSDSFTLKDDIPFKEKQVNVFNEVILNLLDSKKNNIYINIEKNTDEDINAYKINTLMATLNINNSLNGEINILGNNLGDSYEDVLEKIGNPLTQYKTENKAVCIYKSDVSKLTLVFENNILTKIYIKNS